MPLFNQSSNITIYGGTFNEVAGNINLYLPPPTVQRDQCHLLRAQHLDHGFSAPERNSRSARSARMLPYVLHFSNVVSDRLHRSQLAGTMGPALKSTIPGPPAATTRTDVEAHVSGLNKVPVNNASTGSSNTVPLQCTSTLRDSPTETAEFGLTRNNIMQYPTLDKAGYLPSPDEQAGSRPADAFIWTQTNHVSTQHGYSAELDLLESISPLLSSTAIGLGELFLDALQPSGPNYESLQSTLPWDNAQDEARITIHGGSFIEGTMKCIQSPDQHTSNECEQVLCKWIDYRRETTSISGLILNSLSLVLALTEQSANMPEFTSVIEPAIEVLSKILKSFNEGKSTTEGYNTCVQHTINLTGDICATALQSDSNFMQHLKLDFNTYAGLMKKTSQIIEDCNIPRVPADHVQLDLKLDKLNQELESFGARFKILSFFRPTVWFNVI
ncbi:hypothetical protein B0H14DRAFT_2635931 [Mycena olivaceomarginata]|nr:hypothetical protein B0H14DRAFT_2635931 [Mycena olivaceomarginata]